MSSVHKTVAIICVTLHVSVWVEISHSFFCTDVLLVTLHVSVWVEIRFHWLRKLNRSSHAPRERVSWNVLLRGYFSPVGSHAPRERVSWNAWTARTSGNVYGHAPRERVSWNCICRIRPQCNCGSRSTWACELKLQALFSPPIILQSRSTWACELKCSAMAIVLSFCSRSRSTWACELKYFGHLSTPNWVQSRSTWACELKSMPLSGKRNMQRSRSTWACELKSPLFSHCLCYACHAPRERVSWNWEYLRPSPANQRVTLHVSVWVEMACRLRCRVGWQSSRSTWACELKWSLSCISPPNFPSHAPRERVSWNARCVADKTYRNSHAPRERVSWNSSTLNVPLPLLVTLHVSVWVEISASPL